VQVLQRALLQLAVHGVGVRLKHGQHNGVQLGVQVAHLGVGAEQDALGGGGGARKVLVHGGKLARARDAARGRVRDEVPKLCQHVGARLDGRLVRRGRLQRRVHARRRVPLQVLVVGHDLHHAVPYLVRHVVARNGHDGQDVVHVPAKGTARAHE
jgi:hypothetical protein